MNNNTTKLGLALSGGGFRATLYHLGVVRLLKDAGLLASVSHITSVSGGSVLAAHLVMNWQRYTGSDEEFESAAKEIIDFTQLDVRNRIIRRYPFVFALGVLRSLLRLEPSRTLTRTGLLEKYYREYLYGDSGLYELPATPELHILSTDLNEGGLYSFSRAGMFCEERAKSGPGHLRRIPVGLATLPMATTASSAFPGFFPPLQLNSSDIGETEGEFQRQYFTDGGVYDNLGARMFRYIEAGATSTDDSDTPAPAFDAVIASDAGRRIQVSHTDQTGSFLRTALRASDILMDRVWQVEKEHFEGSQDFIFVPITRIISETEDATAPHPKIQTQLSRVRTDLDRFDDLEISGLVRHGYCVARQVIADHPKLSGRTGDNPPWDPLADTGAGADTTTHHVRPGAHASTTTREARHLQRSSKRSTRSLLSLRDWISYIYLPVLLLIVVVIPYFVYQAWDQARFNQTLSEAISMARPHHLKLAALLTNGREVPWEGMPFEPGEPGSLFAEKGLDIISDARILDLRSMRVPGSKVSEEESMVYLYRVLAVRKNAHAEGATALRLPSLNGVISPIVRSNHPELKPTLEYSTVPIGFDGKTQNEWQLKLNFNFVPVGHTTHVVVEALWPAQSALLTGRPDEWWAYQVDAEPEVASAWILVPTFWKDASLRLVRHPNGLSDNQTLVEPTHQTSVFDGTVLNWNVVHPKQGYTYTYQHVE